MFASLPSAVVALDVQQLWSHALLFADMFPRGPGYYYSIPKLFAVVGRMFGSRSLRRFPSS